MKEKNLLFLGLLVSLLVLAAIVYEQTSKNISDEDEEELSVNENSENKAEDSPEERLRYEFDMLKDPNTGTIPWNVRDKEFQLSKTIPKKEDAVDNPFYLNTYEVLGPTNLGGRTRAVAFDVNNPDIMLAGGVSGGIFRSSNGGTNWYRVQPDSNIHNVTTIAQDTRAGHTDNWYFGTGELDGNSASSLGYNVSILAMYHGQGIYKSEDKGQSWSILDFTKSNREVFETTFDFVNKIAVNPKNGDVYAACYRTIMRSQNGGTTWTTVLGNFSADALAFSNKIGFTDVVITSDSGRIYAAFSGKNTTINGVYTSLTGNAGGWTTLASGAGGGLTPAGWRPTGNYGRVVMALAPSNQNVLYVLYDNNIVNKCTTDVREADFFKWSVSNWNWATPNRSGNLPDSLPISRRVCDEGANPFSVQGGYDLAISVKPNDTDFVAIGGISAFVSKNGFADNKQIIPIGGYDDGPNVVFYPNHHPDIHALVFHPTDPKKLLCGSDGGIHITDDVTIQRPVWTSLNNDYVTYQYYFTALDPTIGSKRVTGGSQDNGFTRNEGMSEFTVQRIGDGGATGISSQNAYHYCTLQDNKIIRRLSNDIPGAGLDITPNGIPVGLFATYFLLDPDNTEILYYVNRNSLYRTSSASTITSGTWGAAMLTLPAASRIYSLATTRGNYTANSKLYIGCIDGTIHRVDNPRNANVPVHITNAAGLPNGTVSGIAVDPADDKRVLAVFSNYGITSIWYTNNTTIPNPVWFDVEGNLATPSIRSCAIVNKAPGVNEYYVGTSIGLYSKVNLDTVTPANNIWDREGSTNINLAVVSSLQLRPGDNGLLIGTHGNGMFYTKVAFTDSSKVAVKPNNAFYRTLEDAFDAINFGTHGNGAIEVLINKSTTETSPAALNNGVFTSCTISPTDSNLSVSGDLTDAVIVLNGADNVTIDGRIGRTGNKINLTIYNPNKAVTGGIIRLSNGALNDTMRYLNCYEPRANASVTGGRNINIAQSNPGTSGNNNNVVENCIVNGGRRGIQTFGTAGGAGFTNNGTIIRGNIIKNCTDIGIFIGSETRDNTVDSNEVYNDTLTTTAAEFRAINIQGVGTTNVRKNKIKNLNSDTTVYSFTGIYSIPITLTAPGANASTVNIENNFVSVTDNNPNASFIRGIFCTSTTTPAYTANVYFNSVRVGGNSTTPSNSYGIIENISVANSVYNEANNISINERNSTTNLQYGNYIFTNNNVSINADHNLYWAGNAQFGVAAGLNNITDYQNGKINEYKRDMKQYNNSEQHTAFKNVSFISNTDLHLNPANLGGDIIGKPIAGITIDIDNQIRDNTKPFRGADELDQNLVKVVKLKVAVQGCGDGKLTSLALKAPGSCIELGSTSEILNDTGYTEFEFGNIGSSFYIAVQTQSAIETWSATTQNFTGNLLSYDFTTSQSQAYGGNMLFEGGLYKFYNGDVTGDGTIDIFDVSLIDNDAYNFVSGIDLATDLNCDNIIDLNDFAIGDNNSFNFISVIRPCSPLERASKTRNNKTIIKQKAVIEKEKINKFAERKLNIETFEAVEKKEE